MHVSPGTCSRGLLDKLFTTKLWVQHLKVQLPTYLPRCTFVVYPSLFNHCNGWFTWHVFERSMVWTCLLEKLFPSAASLGVTTYLPRCTFVVYLSLLNHCLFMYVSWFISFYVYLFDGSPIFTYIYVVRSLRLLSLFTYLVRISLQISSTLYSNDDPPIHLVSTFV